MSSFPGLDNSAFLRQFKKMNQFESLPRNNTGVSMVMMSKHPEPFIGIAAQALVKDSCSVHCGMVRKENKIKKCKSFTILLIIIVIMISE